MNFMQTILPIQIQFQKSWRQFFKGLSEEQKLIYEDLQGPSWSPERKKRKLNRSLNTRSKR